jgi:CysZ protein
MTSQTISLAERPWIERFRAGFVAPWEGFRHMNQNPSLWRYGLIPVALNLLVTLVLLAGLVAVAVYYFQYLVPRLPLGLWGAVLKVATGLGLLVVALALAAMAWLLLGGLLSGHFYEKLARQVELQLGGAEGQLRDISFRYQMVDAVRDLAALAGINVGCLLLNCVPGVGSVLGATVAVYFDCLVFGRDYLDFPLALRGLRRAEKQEFFRLHRPETLGLGAAALLFNLVPVLGAILLTTATAGAVLLHRKLSEPDTRG